MGETKIEKSNEFDEKMSLLPISQHRTFETQVRLLADSSTVNFLNYFEVGLLQQVQFHLCKLISTSN